MTAIVASTYFIHLRFVTLQLQTCGSPVGHLSHLRAQPGALCQSTHASIALLFCKINHAAHLLAMSATLQAQPEALCQWHVQA
jgi:hypothetical protein